MSDYTSWSGGYVSTESSSLTQELEYPMPNWFHRTMQRLILGIYWKKADE